MTFDPQFFQTDDFPIAGPARELEGYGEFPPKVDWEGGAKVAVQIVINYEEGSEKSFAMGDNVNDILYELPLSLEGQRDLAVESMYEYGTRAGIWRMLRVFDDGRHSGHLVRRGGCDGAQSRRWPRSLCDAAMRWPTGFRWSNHFEMTRDEEREAIKRADRLRSSSTTGSTAALGWYCREMSVNTRELAGRGGRVRLRLRLLQRRSAVLDRGAERPHLVVPYGAGGQRRALRLAPGIRQPGGLLRQAKAHLDRLRNDGDDVPTHDVRGPAFPRIAGNPARSDALARFIAYGQCSVTSWFARRIDIARTFIAQQPAEKWVSV